MLIAQKLHRSVDFLRSVPTKHYVYLGVGLTIVFYTLNFFIPKQVTFNYGGTTCHKQLTFFSGLHKSGDKTYDVSFENSWKVGSVPVVSLRTCFETKTAPQTGSKIVGSAPFDGPIARTLYNVKVSDAPSAQLQSVKGEVPVSKSLRVTLSDQDMINQYSLAIAGKTAKCQAAASAVDCDVPSLGLAQGETFAYELKRSFKGEQQKTIASGSFKTLRAVTVTQGSVTPGQTVYAKPSSLTITTDKPISSASATLHSDGKPIELDQRIENNVLTLTLKAELAREKTFELVVGSIEASDGSTLVEPYKVSFKTSGGPKVTAVSVGTSGVSQSASIVVTFDQALSKTKDVIPFVTFAGGQASIQKRSDTQVVVQLNSLPLCQPFTVTVKQGIPSEFDLPSPTNWNFGSRTTCYTTSTYGTSLKGRALNAYIFGSSGPVSMYVGGIHGNEPSSTTLMRAWMNELEANPSRFAGKRIVVVPAINPDGLAAGTRTNARGVNLNRNFPTSNWVKSIKDTDGTHVSGGGESPLSEPEASSLAKLTTSYRPRLLLSFHAVGSLAIGDPGGYSASYAAKYASLVGYRDGTNSGNSNFDYNISGAYEDWTFSKASIPSIVVELSSYTSVNSAGHYKALWAMLD